MIFSMSKKIKIVALFFTLLLLIVTTCAVNFYINNDRARRQIKDLYSQADSISQKAELLYFFDDSQIKAICYKIVELNKKQVFDYTMLGYANYKLDKNEEALSLLKKAIELNPRDTMAHIFLSRVYGKMKNFEAGIAELNSANKFADRNTKPDILEGFGYIYAKQDDKIKACEYFQKAVDAGLRTLFVYEYLASTYIDYRNYNKAIEICKKGLAIYPDGCELLFFLGDAYNKINEAEQAVVVLEKAKILMEKNNVDNVYVADIFFELAYSNLLLTKYEKAKEYACRASMLDPTKERVDLCQQLSTINSDQLAQVTSSLIKDTRRIGERDDINSARIRNEELDSPLQKTWGYKEEKSNNSALFSSGGSIVQTIFLLFVIILIYFAPVITAYSRKKRNTEAIFILNLFLGWTFIGWVIALVWACAYEDPKGSK